jgi:hypothetical protein
MKPTTSEPHLHHPCGWGSNYEWKTVTLLAMGFGLVGLDRWILAHYFRR